MEVASCSHHWLEGLWTVVQVGGGIDTEVGDIPRGVVYMALRKEPEVHRGSEGAHKGLGEADQLPQVALELVPKR